MRVLALWLVLLFIGCSGTAEVGDSCSNTSDCDNPDPPPLHAECDFLSCIGGVCSKAGNAGVICNGGTCDDAGMCIP